MSRPSTETIVSALDAAPSRSAEIVKRLAFEQITIEDLASLYGISVHAATLLAERSLCDVAAASDIQRPSELIGWLRDARDTVQHGLSRLEAARAPGRNRRQKIAFIAVAVLTIVFLARDARSAEPDAEMTPEQAARINVELRDVQSKFVRTHSSHLDASNDPLVRLERIRLHADEEAAVLKKNHVDIKTWARYLAKRSRGDLAAQEQFEAAVEHQKEGLTNKPGSNRDQQISADPATNAEASELAESFGESSDDWKADGSMQSEPARLKNSSAKPSQRRAVSIRAAKAKRAEKIKGRSATKKRAPR